MGVATAIEWTDHTFNPWWGCERVSPGCQNCYAEAFAKRTGNPVWGKNADRRRFGDRHWAEPLKWNRQAEERGEPAFVFCASMADVFEDRDDHDADRRRLWALIEETPWLVWQLLTKRPENVLDMVHGWWLHPSWPANVWIGTTVEDQQRADERIPHLLNIPAPVRFLSCEPLLGPVKLGQWFQRVVTSLVWTGDGWATNAEEPCPIHWVICGGESGGRHRPLDLDNARSLQRQCAIVGVPFFFKQVGGRTPKAGGSSLDGRLWKERPEPVLNPKRTGAPHLHDNGGAQR